MTAEHDGLDALMAVITGEPLPEDARHDSAFLAEHRAAEADVALLRQQLARLAEHLTGDAGAPGGALTGDAFAGGDGAPASPPDAEASVPSVRPGRRLRGGRRPGGAVRPGRPARSRRPLRVALGALAGVAACSVVVGLGWLVTHSAPGASEDSAGAKSADQAPDPAFGDGGRPSDPERVLACSQLVVEGTVARVEPWKQSPWRRITLTVIRSYKPARGPARVSFLLDAGATPAPRAGQHVLVRVGRGERGASRWDVGDGRVAADRAWIEQALPGSRHVGCPSDESP
ncbi:hypothetical protein [Streptomyces sp. AF1A]|uniref:hypothetical protein n=1 Tax=Streptomyces sp. AF1A TaxID=3394350 RepID=UPI0039BD7E62